MELTQELAPFKVSDAEELLTRVRALFRDKGILLPTRVQPKTDKPKEKSDGAWIKAFIIPSKAQAFYLAIKSPNDLDTVLIANLDQKLSALKSDIDRFVDDNKLELDPNIRSKLETFATGHISKAKKFLNFGVKKNLRGCNTIEEMREAAGRGCVTLLKEHLLDRIMTPLYEGLHDDHEQAAYLYVLDKVNGFLSELGVCTVNVEVGEKISEDMPYDLMKSDRYITDDPEQKDMVKEIVRYAYAFEENKGADNLQIMDGEVMVAVLGQGGAQ